MQWIWIGVWFLCLHCSLFFLSRSMNMDDRHVCIRSHFSTKNSFANWCVCTEKGRKGKSVREGKRWRAKVRKAVKMECKYWKQLHDTRLGLLKWLQATLFARSLWSSLVIIYDATTFVSPTESKEWHTNTHKACTPMEHVHCTSTHTDTYFMDTCGKEEEKRNVKIERPSIECGRTWGSKCMNSTQSRAEPYTLKSNDVKGFCVAAELKRLTLSHIIRSCHKFRIFARHMQTYVRLKYFIKFFSLDIWMAHPERLADKVSIIVRKWHKNERERENFRISTNILSLLWFWWCLNLLKRNLD